MVSSGMSTLVIGDLHGCGEEFAELLDVARRERCDARIVLVGDLFTKGPRPDLVVDLIAERRAENRRVDLVCGNHDLRLLEALRRRDAGHPLDSIAASELQAIRLLDRADRLVAARRLLAEAVGCVCMRGLGWTVLHGGVVPGAGLDGTSDHDKIHLKAAPGETPVVGALRRTRRAARRRPQAAARAAHAAARRASERGERGHGLRLRRRPHRILHRGGPFPAGGLAAACARRVHDGGSRHCAAMGIGRPRPKLRAATLSTIGA